MRTALFLLCQYCCVCFLQAQNEINFQDLHAPYDGRTKMMADSLLLHGYDGHFEEAIAWYKKSNEIKYNKDNTYRIAIAFCLQNKTDSAKYYLREAIHQGFFHTDLETDPYLQCLKGDQDYETLANSILLNEQRKFNEIDTALQNRFLSAEEQDQQCDWGLMDSLQKANDTAAYQALWEHINITRKDNRLFLDSVIQALGKWPGYDVIGYSGANAAWLIAQHADDTVEFQEKCLYFLNEALKNENARPHQVAYLYDRVKINKGCAQMFGTQNSSNETVTFKDLAEPENVDIRRRSFDLPTLESYRQTLRKHYNIKGE